MEIFYGMGIYHGGRYWPQGLLRNFTFSSYKSCAAISDHYPPGLSLLDTHEAIWFFYAHSTYNTWWNVLWLPVATHHACPAICAHKKLYFLPLPSAGHGRFLAMIHSFVLHVIPTNTLEAPMPIPHAISCHTMGGLHVRRTCGGPGWKKRCNAGKAWGIYWGCMLGMHTGI